MDMSNKSYDPGRTPQCLRVSLVSGLEWVICSSTASYELDVQPGAQPSVIVEGGRTNAERSRVECDVGSPGELYLNDDSGLGYCTVNCDTGSDKLTVCSCDIGETWSSRSELPGDRVHNVIGNRTSSCLDVDMAPSLDTRMIMIRPVDEALEMVTDMEQLSGSSVVTDQETVGGSSVTVAYPECGIQGHGGILEDDDQQFGNTTQIDRVLPVRNPDTCVPNLDPHTPSDDSWSVRGQYPEYHRDVQSEGQITLSKGDSPREDRFTTESFTVEQRDPERFSLDGRRHSQEVETREQDYGVNVVGDQLEAKGQISIQDTCVVVCDNCQTPPASPLLFGKSNECAQNRDCYFTKPVQRTISLVPFLVWISGSRNKSVPPRMSGSPSPTQFRHGTSNTIPNGDNVFTVNGDNPDWSPNGDRPSGVGSQQADVTVECGEAVADDGRGDKRYENLLPDGERVLRKRKISKRLQSRLASRSGYLNFQDFIMDDEAALSYGDIDSLDWDEDDDDDADDDVFYLEMTNFHCIILDKNGKVVKNEQRKSAAQLELCSQDAGEEDRLDWHPESVTDDRQLDSYQQDATDGNQLGSPEHGIKDDDSQLSTHQQNAVDDSQLDLPHQNSTYDSQQVLDQQNNVLDSQLASHQQNVTASCTNVNPSDRQVGMCQENLTNDNQHDLCQQNATYGSQLDLHQNNISSNNLLGLNQEVITDDSQFDSYQEVIVDDSHPELCQYNTTDDTQVDCCQQEGSNDSQILGGVNRVDVKEDVGVKISGEVVCSADDITTSGADVLAPESFSGFIASRDQQLKPNSVVFCSPTGKHRSINPESPHNDEPGAVRPNTGSLVVDGQGADSDVEPQSAAIKTTSDPVSGATGAEASGERVGDDCQRSVTANKAGKLQWQNEHNECYIEERRCEQRDLSAEECHTAGDSNKSNSSSSSSLRSPSRVHADDTSHAGSVQELTDLVDGGRVSGVSLRDVGEVTGRQPVIGGPASGDCLVQNLRFSVTQVLRNPLGSNVDDEFGDVGVGEVEGSGHNSPDLGSSDDDSDIEYLLASDEAPVTEEEFDRLLPAEFYQAGLDVVPSGGTNSLGKLVVSGRDEVPKSEMAADEQPNIAKLERATDHESQHLDAPGVTSSDRGHSPCDLHSGTSGAEIGLPPATMVSSGSLMIIESRSIDGCSLVNIPAAHTTQHPEDSNSAMTSVTEQVSGGGDCTAPLSLLQSVKNNSETISQKRARGVNGSTRDTEVATIEMGSDRATPGAWNLHNGHTEEALGRLQKGGVKSGRGDEVTGNVKLSGNGEKEISVDVSNATNLRQDVYDIDALVAGQCCEAHDTDIDDLYRLAMADHRRSELINSRQEDELASMVQVNRAASHTSCCGDNDAAASVSRSAIVTAPSKPRNASELSSIDGDDETKLLMAKGHCESSKTNNKASSKDTMLHDSAERCPDPSVSCFLKLKPDKTNGVEKWEDGAKMGELLEERIPEKAGSDTTSVEHQEGGANNGLQTIDVTCKMLEDDVICDDKPGRDGTKMTSVGDCLKNPDSPMRSGVIRASAVSVSLDHLSHEVTSDIAALDLCDVFDSTASDSVSGGTVPPHDSLTHTTGGVTDSRQPVVTEPTKNNVAILADDGRVVEPIDRDPKGRDEGIEPLESNDGEVVVNGLTGNAEQAPSDVQSSSRGGCCSLSNEESGIMKTLCSDEAVENNEVRMDRAIDAAIEGDRSNGNSIGRGHVMSDGANASCLEPGAFGKRFEITTNDHANEGEEIDRILRIWAKRDQNGEHPVHSRRLSGSGRPVRLAALDMAVNRTNRLPESNLSINEATFDLANVEANNKLSPNEAGSAVIPPKPKTGEQPSGLDPDLDWAGMINKAAPSGHLVDSSADGVPPKPGEYLAEKDPASWWELAGETKLGVGKFIPTADLASSSQPDSPTNSDRPQVGGDCEPRPDAGVVDCESAQLELSADQHYDTVRSSGHFYGTRERLAVDVHPDSSVNFALHSGSMGQEESKVSYPEGNVSGTGSVSSPEVGTNRREPTAQQKCETKQDNMAPIGNRRIKDGNSLPGESVSTAPTNCIAPDRVPEGGNLSGTIGKEVASSNISSADGVPGQQSGSVSAAVGINQTDSSGNMDTDTTTGVSVSGTGTAINTPPPSVGSNPDSEDSDPDRKSNHSEVATAATTDSSVAGQFDIKRYPEMDRDDVDICSELKDVADPEFVSPDHGLGGISSDQREDVAVSVPDGDTSLCHGADDPENLPVDQNAVLDPVGTPEDQLDMAVNKPAGSDTTQGEFAELAEGQVLDNADDVTREQVVGPISPGSCSGELDSGVSHPEADSLVSVNEHSAGSSDDVVQSPGVVSHPDSQPSHMYSRSDDDDNNKQSGVTGDMDGILSHEVLQRASRHDGGECLYLPDHTSLTSSGTPGMAESALWSPDSGIDEFTESDAMFSDVEGQKEGLATLEDPEQIVLPSADVSFHSVELPNHPGVVCDESARTPPTSGFESSSNAAVRTNDHALIDSNDRELELITAGTTEMGELTVQSNSAPNIPSNPVPSDPDNEVINAVVMAENKSLCVSMPDASGYAQDDSCHLENATDKALIGSGNRNEQLQPSVLANSCTLERGAETSWIGPLHNLEGDVSIGVVDPASVSKMVDVVQKCPQPTDKPDELPQSSSSEGVDVIVGDDNDGRSDRKMVISSDHRKKVKSKVDKSTSSEGFTIVATFGKRKKSKLNIGVVSSGTQAPDRANHGTGSWRDELIETSVGGGGGGGGWVAPSCGGDDEESEFDVGGKIRNGDRKTSGCFNVGEVVGEHVQIGTSFSAAMAEMFERDVQAICDEIERNKVEAVIPECGLRGSRRSSSGSQILDNVQIESGQVTPERKHEKRAELVSDPVATSKAVSRSGKGIGDVESLRVEAKLIFGEVKDARLMAAVWEAERNILDMFGVKLPKVSPANDIKSPAKKIDNSIEEKENWLEPEHQLGLMKDKSFGLSDDRVPETVPTDQGAAEQTHESSETPGLEPTTLQNELTEIPRLEPSTQEAEFAETAGLEPSAVQGESAETAALESSTIQTESAETARLEPTTLQAESAETAGLEPTTVDVETPEPAAKAGLEPSLEQSDSAETCLSEPSSENVDSGETVKPGLVKTESESAKILKPVLDAVESETAASHRLEPSATGLESQGTAELENTTFEQANKQPESIITADKKPDAVRTESTGTVKVEPNTLQCGSSGTEEPASSELESTKPRTGAVLSELTENPILASKSAEPNLMDPPEISSGTAQPESAGTAEPPPDPVGKSVTGKKMADDRPTLSSDKKGYKKTSLPLKKKTKSADLKVCYVAMADEAQDVDIVIFAPPPPKVREAKKEPNAIDLLQEMNVSEDEFKAASEIEFVDILESVLDRSGNLKAFVFVHVHHCKHKLRDRMSTSYPFDYRTCDTRSAGDGLRIFAEDQARNPPTEAAMPFPGWGICIHVFGSWTPLLVVVIILFVVLVPAALLWRGLWKSGLGSMFYRWEGVRC
ncbi:hypothetical protein LSH36_769g00090 [Paralvinella palmiformis]|uniref:Uncharacterized protein n=1 Tax=Paralvinella palmiformis TaxID=53620 RepID=A0AAD9J284_9ANNE|nr:hypothetical protein LSH36_769g00090 [Paralvinella palmiformis]